MMNIYLLYYCLWVIFPGATDSSGAWRKIGLPPSVCWFN